MKETNVVVTGLGCITALGNDADEFWQNIRAGDSGIGETKGITIDPNYPSLKAANIKMERRDMSRDSRGRYRRLIDPSAGALVRCIYQTIKRDGIDLSLLRDAGIIVGTTAAGMITYERFHRRYNAKGRTVKSISDMYQGIAGTSLSCAMERAAAEFGLEGFSTTVESACASGAIACILAYDIIKNGDADMMIAAGVDLLCDVTYSGFSSLRLMEDDVYRPFDKRRKGLMLGEAAAVVLLENEAGAKARGAKIYARLAGCGMSSDAYDMTAPDPEGNGAAAAMCKALDQAGLRPEQIDYINAHGTGTPLNDVSETTAINAVFKGNRPHISSTKSMTGHTLGAAGTLEAIIAVLSIKDSAMLPTANLYIPDPQCQLNHILCGERVGEVKAVMSNSFGFGGINASLIFTKVGSAI